MTKQLSDDDNQQYRDRIRFIAYREARDEGASFITKKWIANKLLRSEKFVQKYWNKTYSEITPQERPGPKSNTLTRKTTQIILKGTAKKIKSCRELAKEIKRLRGKDVSHQMVHLFRVRKGLKPFHIISKPLKTTEQIEDRLWFVNFLRQWDEDFLHLAPSDEFYIYTVGKPNH
ncbi:unnamed protein product [Owenia fusiformis]|uniref:Uncharacterized protein n=1 Tax=Owenia fusiformis TaxID=6347 RepID=A0A8S4Q6P1_OWEFU|nr:unnamed protein product [Owenia fusiformis]